MKHFAPVWLILFATASFSQTFNGAGGLPIPPGAPAITTGITQSTAGVSGVGVLGGCVSIDNVTINLTHTWDGDLGILLVAPDGTFLDLSTGNGGPGDNYQVTVFSDDAAQFITAGTPPYDGNFRPEGRATTLNNPYSNANPLGTFTFQNTFDGINADGQWILYINDFLGVDVGELISWSITFEANGNPPEAEAGPDQTICPGQSALLTASGGPLFQWSNGANTDTTTVSPNVTTTYTVTVTNPDCGTDTDEVTVFVASPQPAIQANPNTICPGETSTLTVQGNFATYLWSTGETTQSITVTSGGSYSVTATDNDGCSGTVTTVIEERSLPSVAFSVVNPDVCAGNCIDVQLNFTGTPPFTLVAEVISGGNQIGLIQEVYPGNSAIQSVCIPPGTPQGALNVAATSLTDLFCLCE